MKILQFITFGIVFGFMAVSCNNGGNNNPKSVPNGTVNNSADTSVQANNGRAEDTMINSLPVH